MTPELAAAVENAYREFTRYRLRGAITVCDCNVCVSAKDARALCTVPLRQISSALLSEYTHSAHGWDDRIADEVRYFLPRYFELIAQADPPTNIDIAICLTRLHDAAYRTKWPAAETAVIDNFLVALLQAKLSEAPDIDPAGFPRPGADAVEDMLCMAAHADGDITALLGIWDAGRGRAATLHMANIVGKADWRRQELDSSFWTMSERPHVNSAMRKVLAWLLRPESRERLEDACMAEQDEAAAALLSHAEGLVMSAILKGIDDQLRR